MHEMSLAMNIVEIATKTAIQNTAKCINTIDVEIGELAGVLVDSLEFCFEAASKNTPAENAALNIISVPGKGRCTSCQKSFKTDTFFPLCPHCDGVSVEILEGKELTIKSINVD